MLIIVGLGNPDKKYQKTRHNLGFLATEELQGELDFPDFVFSKKFNAEISEGVFGGKKIILAKPQTFMNNSGTSVKKLISSFKLQASSLWVIHDDIDLPLGKIRIVKNRGAGGHKGVESVIKELKTKNFVRFRFGIQPKNGKPKNPEKFVLERFHKEEEKIVKEAVEKTAEAVEFLLKEGIEKTMNRYNKKSRGEKNLTSAYRRD